VASANLETPLPASLAAGSSIALFCSGTASGEDGPLEDLEFVVGGERHAAAAMRMPRFDMPCRRSGFWGTVPVRAPAGAGALELGAELRVPGGGREYVTLGRIEIVEPEHPPALGIPGTDDLIAICMGTFDPDPHLFRAQIDSLRAQTDPGWICLISDDHSSPERYAELCSIVGEDERFVISRCERRTGFYRNFERALTLAPAEAQLIALCDQDDVWHPDKLALLRASLGSAMLVYSDQRLVDAHGRVLRETLWRGRANNSTSIGSMLIANTVTGAAALFRREVADRARPFPDSPGIEFHDQWLALVALACGQLAYVDRPLYDYVQHPRAVLGKVASGPAPGSSKWRLSRLVRMREWRAAYFFGYLPGKIRAQTLLLRCGDRLTPSKRRALQRYLTSDCSLISFGWFMLRPLRALAGRTETLGGEWELARGIVWRRLAQLPTTTGWWPERWALDTRLPDPPRFEQRRLRRWRERVSG
jgi:glycosyltransferase involved in cell wall biosynthesis